jgi:hypothetical protein
MRKNILLGIVGAGVAALGFSTGTTGCHSSHGTSPIISSSAAGILLLTASSPPTGPITGGTTITLTGTGFAPGIEVLVGNFPATSVTVESNSTLTAVTPAGVQGPADVTVLYPTTGQAFAIPGAFTYLTLLQLYSIQPAGLPTAASNAPGGIPFILTGAGFLPGLTTVSFGSLPATNVIVQSDNFLTGTIPATITSGTVVISGTAGGQPNFVPTNVPPLTFTYQ